MRCVLFSSSFLLVLLVVSLSSAPSFLRRRRRTTSSIPAKRNENEREEVIWVREKGGERCLGLFGFTGCGDLSLWRVTIMSPSSLSPSTLSPLSSPISPSSFASPLSTLFLSSDVSSSSSSLRPLLTSFLSYITQSFTTHTPSSPVSFLGSQVRLQYAPDASSELENSLHPSEGLCLTQKRYFSFLSAPFLGPCSAKIDDPSTLWHISDEGHIFYSYWGDRCLAIGPRGEALTEKCTIKSSKFDVISHMTIEENIVSVSIERWTKPGRTAITFPVKMKSLHGSSPSEDDMVLFGGGVYSKNFLSIQFDVCTIAWYVDVKGATQDPVLQRMRRFDASKLVNMPHFYEALISKSGEYNRMISISFLMDIKTKDVVESILLDSYLQRHNKNAFLGVYQDLNTKVIEKGMELLFIWRVARSDGGRLDLLDMLLLRDGRAVESKTLSGGNIAWDLFLQFVHPDPVSSDAKTGFASRFQSAMNEASTIIT